MIVAADASLDIHIGMYRTEEVKIWDNVFIGANAVIFAGVNIGNNFIIGAGAGATYDVPEEVVVLGNPAKIICTVKEFIEKCNYEKCSYKPPESFKNIWNYQLLDKEDIKNSKIRLLKK